jgi:hypothetical protein
MDHPAITLARLRRHRLAIFFAGLACLPSLVAGAARDMQASLQRVTNVFQAGNSDEIGPILPQRGKIRVDMPNLAEASSGFLSASQFRYMLDDILHRHHVVSFTFDPLDEPPRKEGTIVGAQLKISTEDQGILHLALQLVFVETGEGWVLREFRERTRARP